MTAPATPTLVHAVIELRDLQLATSIGTYGPGDVVPDAQLLDLTLTVAPHLVLVQGDSMAQVFDYDPLVAKIHGLARERPYATQEYLVSRIVDACAACPEVVSLDIALRKLPVRDGTGSLGVRLRLGPDALAARRPG